jgi:hypothetical protein
MELVTGEVSFGAGDLLRGPKFCVPSSRGNGSSSRLAAIYKTETSGLVKPTSTLDEIYSANPPLVPLAFAPCSMRVVTRMVS